MRIKTGLGGVENHCLLGTEMSKMLLVSCGRANAPNKILTSLLEYTNAFNAPTENT